MTGIMTISMILNGLNLVLVTALIVVYARILLRVRTTFTIGLLLFAVLFFVQNSVSFYFAVTMMPYFVDGLEGFVVTYNALQFVAFSVLNWITWR